MVPSRVLNVIGKMPLRKTQSVDPIMSELIPPASIHDETVPLGVTVAICTYNGAERLPATLKCLRVQVVPPEVLWEVIVIDNASADNGSEVALAYWSSEVPVPLRVVREERLGLSYARERAFAEAIYPIVLFVDDDNWLNSNWVRTVSQRHDDTSRGRRMRRCHRTLLRNDSGSLGRRLHEMAAGRRMLAWRCHGHNRLADGSWVDD